MISITSEEENVEIVGVGEGVLPTVVAPMIEEISHVPLHAETEAPIETGTEILDLAASLIPTFLLDLAEAVVQPVLPLIPAPAPAPQLDDRPNSRAVQPSADLGLDPDPPHIEAA